MKSYWRNISRKVIAQVLEENKGLTETEMRKKISKAYPFGERAMHPYKIWCDQVKKTLSVMYSKHNNEIQGGLFNTEK